jgi:hypothetical protein
MLTCFTLAYISSHQTPKSIMTEDSAQVETVPEVPVSTTKKAGEQPSETK